MAHMSQTCLSDFMKTQGELTSKLITQILSAPQEGSFFHYFQQSGKMSAHMKRLKLQMFKDYRKNFISSSSYDPYVDDVLNTRSERVSLSMEISYMDHVELQTNRSQLKLDDSLLKIISETETDIVFPDQEEYEPRYLNKNDSSQYCNQILIEGSLKAVNEARQRLRKLTPINVSFLTKEAKEGMTIDVIKAHIEQLRKKDSLERVNVQIMPGSQYGNDQRDGGELTVHVSGRMGYAADIVAVCEFFKKTLFDVHNQEKVLFSSSIDIPACQWELIIPKQQTECLFMVTVANITNARIHFPEKLDRKMASFFCTSSDPASVIEARQVLQSLVPLQLCVDVTNEELNEPFDYGQSRMKQEFDRDDLVTVNYCKSEYEMDPLLSGEPMRHCVHFVTQELNVAGLFLSLSKALVPSHFLSSIILDTTDYRWISNRLLDPCKKHIGRMYNMIRSVAMPNALFAAVEPTGNKIRNESMAEYESNPVLRDLSSSIANPTHHSAENAARLLQQGLLGRLQYTYYGNLPRGPYLTSTYPYQVDANNTNHTNTPSASTNVSFSSNRSHGRNRIGNYNTGGQNYGRNGNESYERRIPQNNGNQERNTQKSYVSSNRGNRGRGYPGRYNLGRYAHSDYANVEYKHFSDGQKNWRNGTEYSYYTRSEQLEQAEEQNQLKPKRDQTRNYREEYPTRSYRSGEDRLRESPATPKSADRSSKISLQLRDSSNPKRSSFSDNDGHTTNKSIEPLELIRVASTEPQSLEHSREMTEHRGFSTNDGSIDEANPRTPSMATYAQILEGKKSANGIESK